MWIFAGLMAALVLLVIRSVGWALLVLPVVLAVGYAMLGHLIPGEYGHRGYTLRRLASMPMLSTEGIYGVPMGVAVQYIFLFALLGNLLMKIGTGEVFVDLARALTGRDARRAGPDGGAVLDHAGHDQRLGCGQCGDHRHLHHPAHETRRLFGQSGRRDRGCGVIRRARSRPR
ncbi:hypothetical protein OKA06_18880 [Novosphingobium sp. MW5]|nr:hypothetical protein [Novosphingobium sp. MW5]